MLLQLPATLLFIAGAAAMPFVQPVSSPLPLPPSFIHDGDSPYDVSNVKLRNVLTCPMGNPSRTSRPVLLVPGAGLTAKESYLEGYVAGLARKGYTPCYIELPQAGTGDMQVSSAYVAYSLHLLSWLSSGNQVTVLGHGQATSIIQWALEFFPSAKRVTKSFVGLAPMLNGTDSVASQEGCSIDSDSKELRCYPYVWQQKPESKYFESLHYRFNVVQVPTTLFWSENDEVSRPAYQNAQLRGAVSVAVQDLCPDRDVSHDAFLTDGAAFELVAYALQHGGQATILHANPHSVTICRQRTAAAMSLSGMLKWTDQKVTKRSAQPNAASMVAAEPPLKLYAFPRNQ